MPVRTNVTFDAISNTGKIEFFSGLAVVSSIEVFSTGMVTVSARPSAIVVPLMDFRQWIIDCLNWMEDCERRLVVVRDGRAPYTIELKVVGLDHKLEGKIGINDYETVFHSATNTVELAPRAAFSLTWRELVLFIKSYHVWTDHVILA